ncbi:DUF4375 domain-containing protein [Saccharibacillus sp. CPCC 101409]|uniref:DMP19 family protein n=1 Tax=Saccharibacillus sp. CPCC 101409 TaxID=3058041 RepID=UPI00267320AE|nr:DUF4375 domain-containing protein [Saccharibacillus sp. CPCC 101409]MDO3410929.1 DUF4375 domain-containing protein [Saccharibacillus sp. CPCC 101409]
MSIPNPKIKLLIPTHKDFSPVELAEHILSVIYTEEARSIRDSVRELPESLRTIILIIDFDIELTMSGIVGFIGNSSGRYLNETIAALKLIKASEDLRIMEEIRKRMDGQHFETIEKLAQGLYLYSEDRNILDNLIRYLSDGWSIVSKELEEIRKI